jgi:NADH:ubiquinone oxidoreductase subunit 6 (subunit J)
MNIIEFFFNSLVILIIGLALAVVMVTNPIHAVLLLIMVFFSSSIFLLFIGAEFIGLLYLIVYVGAVAVLFLFVVMMINIRLVELNRTSFYITFFFTYGSFVSLFVFIPFFVLEQTSLNVFKINNQLFIEPYVDFYWLAQTVQLIESLGLVLYGSQGINVLLTALLLLLAMVGAIVLAISSKVDKNFVRQQNLIFQINRDVAKQTVSIRLI